MTHHDRGGELGPLILARATVDRVSHRRGDQAWLDAAWAAESTRVLVLDDGQALVRFGTDGTGREGAGRDGAGRESAGRVGGGRDGKSPGAGSQDGGGPGTAGRNGAELVFVPPAQAPDGLRVLLGTGETGTAYFAVMGPPGGLGARPLPPPGSSPPPGGPGVRPAGLRQAAPLLSDRDAGLLTHAVALANWHATHTHCPRCGAATAPESAGHSRRCPVDGSEHFPRVDPAVIMLVTDDKDRCLLARNHNWPARRVSILAGFVEPGEAIEQAVMREVGEETGLTVTGVRYLGSQPWPMPQSLMLGFRAHAPGEQQIRVDDDEIAEAGWYGRQELLAAVTSGRLRLPPPVSIAHRIIESWYGGSLPGTW